MTVRNGFIPEEYLVTIAEGWDEPDGHWKHQMTPATYQKHQRLLEIARRRTGRTLEISVGWGAYRPHHIQVLARQIHGIWAAWPGTSSHGGFWEGREVMAIDYSNWGWVYGWNRTAWNTDVRAAGLTPDMITPARGYPDEPWHVVDMNPQIGSFSGGTATAGGTAKAPTARPIIEEDEDMPQIIKHKDRQEWSLLDPDVGRDLSRFIYGQEPEFRSEKTASGVVNTYRGFMVTTDTTIAAAWGRNWCRQYQNAPMIREAVDYKVAQAEASRLSHEKHG